MNIESSVPTVAGVPGDATGNGPRLPSYHCVAVGTEGSRLRSDFYRLWPDIRAKLPADWRRHPAAEQAAWLVFFAIKGNDPQ